MAQSPPNSPTRSRGNNHEEEDEGDGDGEEMSYSSGYIRRSKIDGGMDRWEPCMMNVLGNRFSVNLGSEGLASCAMDVCVVKKWESTDPSEVLPLEDFATYFSCSGLIAGSDLLETFVCCALDALHSWYGVMEVSVSKMSLRNLRVFGMHDVEGYKLIHAKYFNDLVEIEPEKEETKKTIQDTTDLPPTVSFPFFPHYAIIFVVGWAVTSYILKVKVVSMSTELLFGLCGVLFYTARDTALPWHRQTSWSIGNSHTPLSIAGNRKRADAEQLEGDIDRSEAGKEGTTSLVVDDSWKKFQDTTSVGRLLRPGIVLKTHEEFAAAFAASGMNKWVTPPGELFWLRGKKYLEDKQKYESLPPYFNLIGCDLWKVVPTSQGGPGAQRRIGHHPQSYVQKVLRNPKIDPIAASQVARGGDIHIFVVNFLMPIGNFVGYFLRPYHEWEEKEDIATSSKRERMFSSDSDDVEAKMNSMASQAVDESTDSRISTSDKVARSLYDAFINGDDEYRNARFKLCPRVFEGPWLVKRAVGKGNKSAKLAEQIPLTYDRGPNHFEVMVDVSSSAVGNRILSVVMQYIKSVTIDLGFIIEGTTEEELPERILGALRFYALDVEGAPYLPSYTHKDDNEE